MIDWFIGYFVVAATLWSIGIPLVGMEKKLNFDDISNCAFISLFWPLTILTVTGLYVHDLVFSKNK